MKQPDDLAPFIRCTDDSGHVYLIPAEQYPEYSALEKRISELAENTDEWYDWVGVFDDRHGRHRVDGKDYVLWISKSEIEKT